MIKLALAILLLAACVHATPVAAPAIPNRAIAVLMLGADSKTQCFDFGRREGTSVADTALCVYPDGRVMWLSVGATDVKSFQIAEGKKPETTPAAPVSAPSPVPPPALPTIVPPPAPAPPASKK